MLGAIRTRGILDRWLGSREYRASSQREELGGGEKGRNGCQSYCQGKPNRIWKTTRRVGDRCRHMQGTGRLKDSGGPCRNSGTPAVWECPGRKTRLTKAYLVWSDNQIPNRWYLTGRDAHRLSCPEALRDGYGDCPENQSWRAESQIHLPKRNTHKQQKIKDRAPGYNFVNGAGKGKSSNKARHLPKEEVA